MLSDVKDSETMTINVNEKYLYFTLNNDQEVRIDLRRLNQMGWQARSNNSGIANHGPLSVRPKPLESRRRV